VSTHLSDEEQVEALKKWWKDNGKSIIGGAVVGLALVGGWQGWQQYSRHQAEQAAGYYSEFSATARAGKAEQAAEQAKRLQDQFGDSAYAVYAALQLARLAYDDGQPAAAREHLQWALDHAADPALAQVARLRLARLLLDQGELDAARSLAAAAPADAFAGQYAELRGDLAMAAGDRAAAGAAYQEALATGIANADLVRLKLADTGHAPAG
jgi:predicted negative regulator of RcsB-dependent stress response